MAKVTFSDLIAALSGGGMALSFGLMVICLRGGERALLPHLGGVFAASACAGLLWLLFTRCTFSLLQLCTGFAVYAVTLTAMTQWMPDRVIALAGANLMMVLVGLFCAARFASVAPRERPRLRQYLFAVGLLAPHLVLGGALAANFSLQGIASGRASILGVIGSGAAALLCATLLADAWRTYCPLARLKQQAADLENSSLGMLRRRKTEQAAARTVEAKIPAPAADVSSGAAVQTPPEPA